MRMKCQRGGGAQDAHSIMNILERVGTLAHHVERIGVDICRLERVDLHLEL